MFYTKNYRLMYNIIKLTKRCPSYQVTNLTINLYSRGGNITYEIIKELKYFIILGVSLDGMICGKTSIEQMCC